MPNNDNLSRSFGQVTFIVCTVVTSLSAVFTIIIMCAVIIIGCIIWKDCLIIVILVATYIYCLSSFLREILSCNTANYISVCIIVLLSLLSLTTYRNFHKKNACSFKNLLTRLLHAPRKIIATSVFTGIIVFLVRISAIGW